MMLTNNDPFIRHEDVTMAFTPMPPTARKIPVIRSKAFDLQMLTPSEQQSVAAYLEGDVALGVLSVAAQTFVRRHCQEARS